ncbi:MAG: hypothetical protein R2865_13160 [Deinococcales bacterium]
MRLFGVDPISQPKVKSRLGAVVEALCSFLSLYDRAKQSFRLHAKPVGKVDDKRIGEVLDMLDALATPPTAKLASIASACVKG